MDEEGLEDRSVKTNPKAKSNTNPNANPTTNPKSKGKKNLNKQGGGANGNKNGNNRNNRNNQTPLVDNTVITKFDNGFAGGLYCNGDNGGLQNCVDNSYFFNPSVCGYSKEYSKTMDANTNSLNSRSGRTVSVTGNLNSNGTLESKKSEISDHESESEIRIRI
jgi:hypothetical protein